MTVRTSLACAAALALALSSHTPLAAGDKTVGSASNPGVLKTKVKPDDAGVWVNGEYVGHADRFSGPGENLYLPPGEHEIRFTMVYFQDYVQKVTIEPGQKTVIRKKLDPSNEKRPTGPFAKVKIHPTNALNAAVLVNGRHIGYADQINKIAQTLLLEAGKHEIELQLDGYKPYKTTIEVEAGERRVLNPTLEAQ